MYSIRRRLTLALVAGFTLLIAGTGFLLDRRVSERVTEEFDAALVARTRALMTLTEEEERKRGETVEKVIVLDLKEGTMPEFERAERPDYFQYWFTDGRPIFGSGGRLHDLPLDAARARQPQVRDITLPDGRAGRAAQITFSPEGDDERDGGEEGREAGTYEVVLMVARGREPLDGFVRSIRLVICGVGAAVVLLAALFVWRALVMGLRPVESIAAQVEALDAEKLGTRIDLPRSPRELAPIVQQLNALLGRLEGAFERERRFTGNVAHELRTPIAELRAAAAVAAKWPDDQESVARFFGDVGHIARRMEGLVVNLLLLARCQAGAERTEIRPANLKEAVEETRARLDPAARNGDLRWRLDIPDDLVVQTDPGKLSIILTNLLDNAVTYARQPGEIGCTASRNGRTFRLEVSNPAPRLSPEDLVNLTEPFWRRDEARTSSRHAGLGLSLAAALARLLELDLRFAQDADGTFRARVEGYLLPSIRSRSTK